MIVESPAFTVGLARCESYDREEVAAAVALAVRRAGGLPSFDCGEVLIKANMLSPSLPERAVTTHPEVLRALVGEVRAAKGEDSLCVKIADSPGYIFTDASQLLERTGVGELVSLEGVSVGVLSEQGYRTVRNDSFRALEEARISIRYLDAPFCVNAAKLKTHVETEMTGCIKNIFGTADTDTRKRSHRSVSKKRLADAISDLYGIRPPEFHVMDAVYGMEGDGPSHGRPKKLGWVIASRNALAIDWIAATIMGYENPAEIPLIESAVERGLGPRDRSDIVLSGAEWAELPAKDFRRSTNMVRILPVFLRGLAHGFVSVRPELRRVECVRCWICKKVCPVDAIRESSGYPAIDERRCVRCLCCCEMCPPGAMKPRKNLLAALLSMLRERKEE